MILALKIALVVIVAGLVVFTADYTRLTRGACLRDPIGLTLVIKDICLIGTLAPLLLAAFFRLSVLGSEVGSWILIAFLFLAGAAVFWRLVVFEQISRQARKQSRREASPAEMMSESVCEDGEPK